MKLLSLSCGKSLPDMFQPIYCFINSDTQTSSLYSHKQQWAEAAKPVHSMFSDNRIKAHMVFFRTCMTQCATQAPNDKEPETATLAAKGLYTNVSKLNPNAFTGVIQAQTHSLSLLHWQQSVTKEKAVSVAQM